MANMVLQNYKQIFYIHVSDKEKSILQLHGPRSDKTCLPVSDKLRFKPVCSDTETTKLENFNFACYKFRYNTFQYVNNEGADLVCAFVVCKPQRQVFSH